MSERLSHFDFPSDKTHLLIECLKSLHAFGYDKPNGRKCTDSLAEASTFYIPVNLRGLGSNIIRLSLENNMKSQKEFPNHNDIDFLFELKNNSLFKNKLNRVMLSEYVMDADKYTCCSFRVMSRTKFKVQ
jgi:hypothetical protein